MKYQPGFTYISDRFGPITSALFPTSVASGFIGTFILVVVLIAASIIDNELQFRSLDEFVLMLIALGAAISLGTIAGTFIVAFYLAIFGWPVALLLGEQIRQPIGMAAAILAAVTATLFALSWVWGWSFFGGRPFSYETLIPIVAFALPASLLYRKHVIDALDESSIA